MTLNVTFLGDSITVHALTLSTWFGSTASGWTNAGIGGNTTAQMLARINTDVPNGTEKCVVLGGINDITNSVAMATIEANLTAIYANLLGRGITPIASTVMPVCAQHDPGVGPSNATTNANVLTLNSWIRTYCASQGITVNDYHPLFVLGTGYGDPNLYDSDGLHPNDFGRGVWTCVAGYNLQGSAWYTKAYIQRDFPATSGETVLLYRGYVGGVALARNWTLRVGSSGYTGTGMTDAQLDTCARTQGVGP